MSSNLHTGAKAQLSRRGFIKLTAAGLATTSLGALGFGLAGEAMATSVRPFKLTATTETRNTCTYCSVGCGILIYSLGDRAKNAESSIIHIEGDPDHPVNRGTLCPKGSALLDVDPLARPAQISRNIARPEQRIQAGFLGFCAGSHREADEGRPRQELRRQERRGDDRQPLAHDGHAGGLGGVRTRPPT